MEKYYFLVKGVTEEFELPKNHMVWCLVYCEQGNACFLVRVDEL